MTIEQAALVLQAIVNDIRAQGWGVSVSENTTRIYLHGDQATFDKLPGETETDEFGDFVSYTKRIGKQVEVANIVRKQ